MHLHCSCKIISFSQREIEQLREELIALTRSSGDQHVEIQTEAE